MDGAAGCNYIVSSPVITAGDRLHPFAIPLGLQLGEQLQDVGV